MATKRSRAGSRGEPLDGVFIITSLSFQLHRNEILMLPGTLPPKSQKTSRTWESEVAGIHNTGINVSQKFGRLEGGIARFKQGIGQRVEESRELRARNVELERENEDLSSKAENDLTLLGDEMDARESRALEVETNLKARIVELEDDVARQEGEIDDLVGYIEQQDAEADETYSTAKDAENMLREEVSREQGTEREAEYRNQVTELEHLNSALREQSKEEKKLQRLITRLRAERDVAKTRMTDLETSHTARLQQLENSNSTLTRDKERLNSRIAEIQVDRDSQFRRVGELEGRRDECNRLIGRSQKSEAREELRMARPVIRAARVLGDLGKGVRWPRKEQAVDGVIAAWEAHKVEEDIKRELEET
ncbi:uncharacterized protein LTR77_008193 [Saxophila tyrrhenica]|uniref:Tropomyosin n=1 Tax=Saxophila tyrrhenica TaxID=1690608 RepID=A0AAV9P642_9PEZI|nr:hypothetical protein LTR77_008193 [Saxophila tyrrhenica]